MDRNRNNSYLHLPEHSRRCIDVERRDILTALDRLSEHPGIHEREHICQMTLNRIICVSFRVTPDERADRRNVCFLASETVGDVLRCQITPLHRIHR